MSFPVIKCPISFAVKIPPTICPAVAIYPGTANPKSPPLISFLYYIATFSALFFLNLLTLFYHVPSFISILGIIHKQKNTVVIDFSYKDIFLYFRLKGCIGGKDFRKYF